MKRVVTLLAAILACSVGSASVDAQSISYDPAPGTYRHSLVLSVRSPQPDQTLYYRLAIDGTQQTASPPMRYTAPLYLTALPGKQRTYRISVESRIAGKTVQTDQSVWTIDRTAPRNPTPAGSAEPPKTAKLGPPPTSIPVLSPVAGSFGNEQLFYVNAAAFTWVRYTLDGSDPTKDGKRYTAPFLIKKSGAVDLRVAALGSGAEKPLTAEVQYTVTEGEPAPFAQQSGQSAEPVVLEPPKSGRFYYTFREGSPGINDMHFDRPLSIGTPPGSIGYTVLRMRSLTADGSWGPDFRYFFAIDRRPAPDPTIALLGGSIATTRTRIRIDASPYTTVFYTTDGSSPDKSSARYDGAFAPILPPNTAGTLTIRARAYAPNGMKSSIVSARYPFITKAPSPPTVKIIHGGQGGDGGGARSGSVHLSVEVPKGSIAVYERTLDGTTPDDPITDSPRATRDMVLSVPRGANVVFSLKFATIDATGAISVSTKLIQVRVDEEPPSEPHIEFADDTLTITGSGLIRYTLTDSGAQPETPGPDSQLYTGPLSLAGKPGMRVEYRVAAVAAEANGLRSEVSLGGPYIVDRRTPKLPVFWGLAAGGTYNDERTLNVEQEPGVAVHYTLSTDGHPPEAPTMSSPVFGSDMQFTVPAGTSKSYVVKLRAAMGEHLGPVETIPFTIDRIAPTIPAVSGLSQGGVYNHALTLEPPKMPVGETLYISSTTGTKVADPLGPSGRPFETPVRFDAPQGGTRTFHVRLAARDLAGNTTEDPTTYALTVDRRVPSTPSIHATPSGGTVAGEVSVTIGDGSETYRYELSDDGSIPPAPTRQSPQYKVPLILKPAGGVSTLYTLLATAEDSAGNISPAPAVYRVLVSPPGAAGSSASGAPAESVGGAAAKAGAPAEATGGASTAAGTGKRSQPTGRVGGGTPPSKEAGPRPLVAGVKNDGLYNAAVTLKPATAGLFLRYEIDPNGDPPPAVTRFSPALSQEIVVDPPPGETRQYEVRVASFANADSGTAVGQELVRFTIDKTPPGPPTISGIVDNARYQQPESFTLQASGGTIYYSLDKLSPFISAGSLSSTKYTKYSSPVTIGVGEVSARYRVHAYTVDAAGNRSLTTPEWTVYFDRGVVYAAPFGSDANDGTSIKPVKSLKRALQLAIENSRDTVFLASGSYTLDKGYRITSGVSILGDFDPKDWHQATSRGKPSTIVTAPPDISGDTPLFSIEGGGLSIENILLRSTRSSGRVFDLQKGSVSISNSSIDASDPHGALLHAGGGTISLDRVVFENRGGGPTLSANGATVDVNGSTFSTGETTSDSVLVALEGGSTGTISDSTFLPSFGLRTVSIRVVGSKLSVTHSQIRSGTATRESVGLFAADSTLDFTDTTIAASDQSHLTFGIQAQGSTVKVDRSQFAVTGSTGATGIWADSSTLNLTRTRLTGDATSEFLYLVNLTNTNARVLGNILRGASSGDYLALSLAHSKGTVTGNTFYGGSGTGRASAIALEQSREVAIVDNIISRSKTAPGEAISIRSGAGLPRIIANNIYGYPDFLRAPGGREITSLGALDAAGAPGDIEGNLSEPPERSFAGVNDLHLKAGSACIGAGVDPARFGGLASDLEGTPRTAPYDIGALRPR